VDNVGEPQQQNAAGDDSGQPLEFHLMLIVDEL
jgi:hypothetical protein